MNRIFSYTDAVRDVMEDMCTHIPEFGHVRTNKVLVSFAQARKRTSYGVFAKLVPLRMKDGAFEQQRELIVLKTPKWLYKGKEYLYILYVYLPRFHDQPFREKILTLIHELHHISPEFNGDLRRFGESGSHHGHSVSEYDAQLEPLVEGYLAKRSGASCLDFLRVPTEQLESVFGRLTGLQIRMPTVDVDLAD